MSQPGAVPRQVGVTDVKDMDLEALRRHGFGVAYRMLGSVAEAEDVAQEALLRLTREERTIDEPAAWITTVVTRLSISVLRSARSRRESYVGPWLPEPLLEDPEPGPASRAELADSLSLALLVLLERLTPVERAAYLLREVFGYGYAEIGEIIERTEVNSRQLVTRARKHVEASRPRFDPDEEARDALLERFLAAAEEGDLEGLEEMLAKDAVLYADGGGKTIASPVPVVRRRGHRPVHGRGRARPARHGLVRDVAGPRQRPARPSDPRPRRGPLRRDPAGGGREGGGAPEVRRPRRG